MRRLLAILLLAAFGLPTVAPLLAQMQYPDRNLPACCRRNGAHHCAGMLAMQDSKTPAISGRCTSFPEQAAVASLTPAALLTTQAGVRLPSRTHAALMRAETRRRLSRERARQDRGPPSDTSL